MARRYRSRAVPSPKALAALGCAATGLCLVLSMSWHYLGSLGNVLLLGTVARALVVGLVLAYVGRRVQMARPGWLSALAVLTTFLSVLGAHYDAHRRDRSQKIYESHETMWLRVGMGANPDELRAEHEEKVERLTFLRYLAGYFGFEGQARDGSAASWGPWVGIGVSLVELLLALLIATYHPYGVASEPACPRCGSWGQESPLARAAHGHTPSFVDALLAGKDPTDLLKPADTREHLGLSLSRCARHPGFQVLRLREHFYDRSSRNLLCRHRGDFELSEGEFRALQEHVEGLT